ncbi:MAG: ATP-binding cassette domain-containing protein [Flavobacteriales bacterium]|nr:ATP-binding cassette domain-containing protein [Flavobacteriaceae bacterium]MDO7582112.1 ATP-binding cassette domain-containing protein [Flavobacteriaceae bacterium]MDO7592221.1 ATP-binding cassette domain-containing protein [Flavobacteriaceae bacterium]MDO7599084.1 ATP-binding cassette domain-containing protein [Flavobacteriaceae bacterium]MDO7603051.1 ATP-binding cassette domain-containing protein [Flavobacteriaceae bacterium]
MLSVQNVSVSFGGEYLFKDISFRLGPGNRVGLVGKNGAGKSTLLHLIARDTPVSEGSISQEKTVQLGFLKQDIDFDYGRTVLEEAYQAFTEIKALEQQMEDINLGLTTRTDYESDSYNELIVQLNEVTERYEIIGGYNYQGTTERILQGLGFSSSDFNKQTDTFSGGWRMRIELAKLLLQPNDILLLDEPTNHLDIESIIWLEEFLKRYRGAVVLVSHDKMFLDQVTNRTIEIVGGRIYDYNKPYSKYMILREEILTQQRAAQKNQEKQIQQTEKLIERFKAKASKATMAQSLMKKLDKIDRIELDVEDNRAMKLSFPVSKQPGKMIIEAEGIKKAYGEKMVLQGVDFEIARGTKTAFVGQNGQGKSTLAKIIVNEIDYEGSCSLGYNVMVGYFAQNQAEYLDGDLTLLETMQNAATDVNRSRVRDILGSFLFRGDDVEKRVKVLSGGERNRLALAKLLLMPFNVLIMDEPTNHLDIDSKNVLKEALRKFEGTLILISHDRDFLQGLSDRVLEFKDHKLKEYLGDINLYLEQKNLDSLVALELKEKIKAKKTIIPKNDYETQKKLKSLQNKQSKVEREIADLERAIKTMDSELEINYEQTILQPNFFENYNGKKDQLAVLLKKWEVVAEELMGIEG